MLALLKLDSKAAETDIVYNLEVKVSSNVSKQEDISDDDESEDAYANGPLADENWLTQYEAERQRNKNLMVLLQ